MIEQLYYYGGIFLALFLTGIGIPPMPEELPIIGAAITTASHPEIRWYVAWPVCIAGVVSADLALYWIGRAFGNRIFSYRWVQRYIPPHRHEKIVEGFHTHGVKILLSARLLPGLRSGVFMTAGAMRYPFVYFLLADAIYAIPGVGLVFFGSYFLAESFSLLIDRVHQVQYWLLALAVLAAVGFGLYRYFRVAREHAAHDDFQAPTLPELMHSKHPHEEPPKDDVRSAASVPSTNSTTVSPAPAASGTHPAAKPE